MSLLANPRQMLTALARVLKLSCTPSKTALPVPDCRVPMPVSCVVSSGCLSGAVPPKHIVPCKYRFWIFFFFFLTPEAASWVVKAGGSSRVGNRSGLWIRAASSPARGRFYLCSRTDFVSAFLHADTTNNAFTFLEENFFFFAYLVRSTLRSTALKKESWILECVVLRRAESLLIRYILMRWRGVWVSPVHAQDLGGWFGWISHTLPCYQP